MTKIITPQDANRISKLNNDISNRTLIHLKESDDIRSKDLKEFCDHLVSHAPKINITKEKVDSNEIPVILIGKSLSYHAVPLGAELEPFLKALSFLNKNNLPLSTSVINKLKNIKLPASLKIYMSPQCPHCPVTIGKLIHLPFANDLIKLTIIDGFLFPEMSKKDKIQSAPTVILDEQFRWSGSIQLEEVLDVKGKTYKEVSIYFNKKQQIQKT